MKGWAKLGADVERLRQTSGAATILTDRYAITGELAFYGDADRVAQINERIRYASFPPPDEARLKDAPALLILRKGADPAPFAAAFAKSTAVTTLGRDTGPSIYDFYDAHLLSGYRGGLFR